MDGSSEKIQFSWGKLRRKGGVKMDMQYYESFTFDNVKYSLYDCVYLFKTGDPEPYIGKIVKIWEQNEAKKVKILWFFLPDEIQKYLQGTVMENEVFLASGIGPGLVDINPVEAIAGKCTVICISKDERNRQPSPRSKQWRIISSIVDVLLNPKDEQVTSSSVEANVEGGVAATVPPPQSVVPLSQSTVKEENESPTAAVSLLQSVVKEDKKPPADIPVSPLAVKKEHKKPVVGVPCSQSEVKDDEKPVASAPSPRSAARENIPKHTQNASSGERPPKKLKLTQDAVQNMAPAVPDRKTFELTSRQADRSKWFKIPWDERLRIADEKGTLVYIQNLDIQFGAADIEELIREALQLNCIAKPINHPTYDDPNNGKAYAVFRTKSGADTASSKINSGLVVGGRPLYCSKGLLKVPKPTGTLVGQLSFNIKIRRKQREEQKKAVSTSHCSQPNTIEFDLALDWMVVREKQEEKFRILHKLHEDQRKGFANIGSKNATTGK